MISVSSLVTASACVARSAGVTRWLLINVQEASVGEPAEKGQWINTTYSWLVSSTLNERKEPEPKPLNELCFQRERLHSACGCLCLCPKQFTLEVSLWSVPLPPRGLRIRAGTRFAVVVATSGRVAKVAGATFVTLRPFCVVLAALQWKEHPGHSLKGMPLTNKTTKYLTAFLSSIR